MNVFKIKNECGITIIKVEQMTLHEFGKLMARIHNELPEGESMTLDELCNKIEGVSREMIELAIQELIEDGEIYEPSEGVYKLL